MSTFASPPTAQQVVDWIRQGESETVEFKNRLPPDSITARNLTAFANSSGGVLLIGVEDDGEVVGVPKQELDTIVIRLQHITAAILGARTEVGAIHIQGKPVVYAIVDKVPSHYGPVTTATGEAFERRSDTTVRIPVFKPPEKRKITGRTITGFMAMSFREEEEPSLIDYFHAVERAAASTGYPISIKRIDLVEGDYEISQRVMDEIDQADFVIADFTLSPRNVYFEVGYARGAGKPVVQSARQETTLEFDVRNWRTIFYRNATELEVKLKPALVAVYKEIFRLND